MEEVIFAAGPARAFYLAGSQLFTIQSLDLDGITVNSYAIAGVREHQQLALLFAERSLTTFEELFGPYPYVEFDVISSPMQALGIEYPGIIGIYNNLYDQDGTTSGVSNTVMLESVIVHEVGHQWFYNVIGSDQQDQPWVDESLVQYITYLNFATTNQDQFADGLASNWVARLNRVEEQDIPIGLPADRYEGPEYSGIVYGRGPLFFQALEEEFGRDMVIAAIRRYFQRNQWENAGGEDIRNSLEAECNCDLSQFFEEWIYPVDSTSN
jgi:aminopeptidase N